MSLETLKNLATSKLARQILIAKKNSPRVMFVAGTVGVVGAAVLACRATLKVGDVLDEHDKYMGILKDAKDARKDAGVTEGSAVERIKENETKLKIKTALDIAKLYAPAVGLGAVSILALTGSHVVLSKRNGTLMAAYAGLDRAYKEYRQRVVGEYGPDVDRKFASGAKDILVEEKLSDGTTKTRVESKVTGDKVSPYTALFDEHSTKFSREPGRNAMTVQMNQQYANDKLRVQGHLFLNEVYDMLGLPRTAAGAVTGWVYRKDNEEKNGDNYVDFGVFSVNKEAAEAFVAGDESAVWLDFNVDGIIYDKI